MSVLLVTCERSKVPLKPPATFEVGVGLVPAWGGCLQVEAVAHGGLALRRLRGCELRPRQGGERFQAAPGAPARSLKKQFQAAGVPDHDRHVPLLFDGDQLLFVPGLGIDARARAAADEPQVLLRWQPIGDAPGPGRPGR